MSGFVLAPTYPQAAVLRAMPVDEVVSAAVLAGALHISVGAVSWRLIALEDKGLVETDPEDAWRHHWRLTDAGRALVGVEVTA